MVVVLGGTGRVTEFRVQARTSAAHNARDAPIIIGLTFDPATPVFQCGAEIDRDRPSQVTPSTHIHFASPLSAHTHVG